MTPKDISDILDKSYVFTTDLRGYGGKQEYEKMAQDAFFKTFNFYFRNSTDFTLYLRSKGNFVENRDLVWTRKIGVGDLPEGIEGLSLGIYADKYALDTDRRNEVIVLYSAKTWKKARHTKTDFVLDYLIAHEWICHAFNRLGEEETYSALVDFFRQKADINSPERKYYQKLAKIAELMYKEYKKNPYETEKITYTKLALMYINSELSRANISDTYRKELLRARYMIKSGQMPDKYTKMMKAKSTNEQPKDPKGNDKNKIDDKRKAVDKGNNKPKNNKASGKSTKSSGSKK